ncbi:MULTISPECIES: aldo/keto reductase [unclassified Plantactinospora]|uniref:aldo/keto reductase n=1 Tax=unclassified Plantactinospora TaxID=2631981 RepID=UPI000D1710C2|nr:MULTISPECIES: aldo/keto reductase [unclassified Plantactinospora]AVT28307.1 aldo/keto reductase [Plantactinospora sp. BC1]AVT38460.1 aldo/keto reductase [Plantactinospora sp. BB1]
MTGIRVGRSDVVVSPLGLGCAPIGNLYTAVGEAEALATVAAAWESGIRYFDTAPHYGLGLSERRLGDALRTLPRAEYTVSSKVGRLLVPDRSGAGRRDDEGFDVPADHRRLWDFSADGVRRSLEASLVRLGLDRIDLVLIHDPEDHRTQALEQGYPALHELRAQGVVGAIGVGSKQWQVLHRFAAETDVDAVMVAGRYTLLEQPALDTLLPECERRGVSVLNAGVFNSGLLAVERPHAGLPYDYADAPAEILDRARAIATLCAAHGTTLPAAALAFAAAHPAVASVVVGAHNPDQVRRNAALHAAAPPSGEFWAELVAVGLLRPDAPVPTHRVGTR